MTKLGYARVDSGKPMTGVFEIGQEIPSEKRSLT